MSTNHNLFDEKGEPKRYRTEVLPLNQPNALSLGQTGSVSHLSVRVPAHGEGGSRCLQCAERRDRLSLLSRADPAGNWRLVHGALFSGFVRKL